MIDKQQKFTNLDKIYWPDEGYTKGDHIDYYEKISDYILPYLKDRPESLNRHPEGIYGESFYHKNMDNKVPGWVETFPIKSEEDERVKNYLLCQNKETLLYMANLGCIEINPWNSRINNLNFPDYIVIDLDPEGISFSFVVEATKAIKDVLDELKLLGLPKTSGATGMHVYVPLGAKYDYEQSRNFAKLIAVLAHNKTKDFTSLERSPSKRQKKVYFDYLQNVKGQTLAAPYSLRPRKGAPVSTPLAWEELNSKIQPQDYNLETIFNRLKKYGDLFKPILTESNSIEKVLDRLR